MCIDVFISEFLAFRDQCIWLRCCYNTYNALYESTPETIELLSKVATIFFGDLNKILIEYCWLQICKITDPAQTKGRDNLTVAYINSKIEAMGLISDEIRQYSNSINEYRNVLNTGRNRLVTHLDKET